MCASAGFLVPDSAVDYDQGTANHIAIQQGQWKSCFQCGQAYGQCTVVAGSSPYDQFSPFRNTTIASYLSADSDTTLEWSCLLASAY